jgi:NAD(P)-dependent dehydrogenase (short-subunit alcohol dehydrogenase family)
MIQKGDVALVTGGGRGIGRATAIALARAGARVVACSRTLSDVEAVASLITGEGGSRPGLEMRCRNSIGSGKCLQKCCGVFRTD